MAAASPKNVSGPGDLASNATPDSSLTAGCEAMQDTRLEIPSQPDSIDLAMDQITASALASGFANRRLDHSLRLALVEALTNAMEHGNQWDPGLIVRLRVRAGPTELRVSIQDQGTGFDWRALPDPTRPQRLTRERGRGAFLMRAAMDRVEFNACGNRVTLAKSRQSD